MPSARILQVIAHDVIGGTELKVAMLAERMRAAGLDIEVAFLDAPGPIAARLERAGVPRWSLGGGALGRLGAAARLARLMRSRDYALVEAYGIKASFAARLLALGARPRPVQVSGVMGRHITEVVDLDERKGRVALLAERATGRLVDAYDVINKGALEMLLENGVERERLHYIPNGIDVERWPMRDTAPAGDPVVVCSARFVPRKRQEDLVRALALLSERGVEVRGVLAGTGPTMDECRHLAAGLGIADRVEFPGAVSPERVRELVEGATAFCLPTLWEGMPAAVLEAMALGVPVVATDVDGIRELVEDGRSGLLVAPRSPDRLADALQRVIEDDDTAAALALEARRLVEREYSFTRLVERKQALYASLLSGPR